MRATVLPVIGLFILFLVGCGPVISPMPPRLDPASQKQIDDAWNEALTPVNRHNNQTLLDLLVTTQAYQLGVDRLMFRSEKAFVGGRVVMEIAFDRTKPGEDRFTVTVLDPAGKVLRVERYGRDQVEQTYQALNQEVRNLRQKQTDGTATPAELLKLKGIEDRLKVVENVIPKEKVEQVK